MGGMQAWQRVVAFVGRDFRDAVGAGQDVNVRK